MTNPYGSILASSATPPDAAKQPHAVEAPFGAVRNDDYYW